MSQTATIDGRHGSDFRTSASNRVADAARGASETAKNMAKDAVAATTAAVERQSAKATDAARQVGESSKAKLETANRGGAALAGFWLKVMQEQTAQNIEAMRSLAAAQTWEEKLAVQSSLLSGSLARMQDVFARYMELTGTMTSDMLTTGTGNADKAG
jgi:hypothetical protein